MPDPVTDKTDGTISFESRNGWSEQFRNMAEAEDDKLIDETMATTWDEEEWEW